MKPQYFANFYFNDSTLRDVPIERRLLAEVLRNTRNHVAAGVWTWARPVKTLTGALTINTASGLMLFSKEKRHVD